VRALLAPLPARGSSAELAYGPPPTIDPGDRASALQDRRVIELSKEPLVLVGEAGLRHRHLAGKPFQLGEHDCVSEANLRFQGFIMSHVNGPRLVKASLRCRAHSPLLSRLDQACVEVQPTAP